MSAPKYYVAKYIPDLQRMEPRNVGIVVWSPEGIEARFVAEKPDRAGEVDGRAVPSFVTSPTAYRQWIQFWRAELAKPQVESSDGGPKATKDSPDFLAAVQSWNRGNFVLVDGGHLLDVVDADDLPALADHLFETLVDASPSDETRDPTLDELCDQLFKETNLAANPHFHTRYPVTCEINPGTSAAK
jgi:hypothetical protein